MKLLIISLEIFAFCLKLGFGLVLGRRIMGGQPIDIKDVPYQVSLQFSGYSGCGGALLSESYVLTAAHCVDEKLSHVRAGSSRNDEGGELIEIDEVISHPLYKANASVDYDFAILRLKKLSKYPEVIQFVKLPEESEEPLPGEMAVASGWGYMYNVPSSTKHLRAVTVPIVDEKTCKQVHHNDPDITDRMFCAGYTSGGRDACKGDSGGPLVTESDKVLIGIVSWGKGDCGEVGTLGVYAKVSSVRSWIRDITNI